MRPIYPVAILALSLGGGVVYSAAPSKPDAASGAQQEKPAKPERRAARTPAAHKDYIGSTYVGTRSAAQGAGKPLAPGGAAYREAQQDQTVPRNTQAQDGGPGTGRVSPARGSLASEQPAQSRPAEQTGAANKSDAAEQQQGKPQSGQEGAQQSGAQSGGQQSPQGANASAAKQDAGAGKSGFDVKSTFRNVCGFCHEDYGRHAGKGPQLMSSERTDDFLADRIKHGLPGRMPGFGTTFSEEQVQQIVKFIRALKPGEEPKNPA